MTESHRRLDLSQRLRIHLIGVGGTGMSPIARTLAEMGQTVTGSDTAAGQVLGQLEGLGVRCFREQSPGNVHGADVICASSAIRAANTEVVEAERLGMEVITRAGLLAAICSLKKTVAVAGTHGKTTTSSMLAAILEDAGLRPSFVIGESIPGVGIAGRWDRGGDWLVVEADESDGTFLDLGADAVVVTSIEPDHLGFYGDEGHLRLAFMRFVTSCRGPRVLGTDDLAVCKIASALSDPGAVTYGTNAGSAWRVEGVSSSRWSVTFRLARRGKGELRVDLPVPALHNALNATAALATAAEIGVAPERAAGSLSSYRAASRRFELRGERDGITFVDDYGHLPGEVKATLASARQGGWKRVVVVFQPHRYTRTASLWRDFADAFTLADVLVVTGIYTKDEDAIPGVTGELVADAVRGAHPEADVVYIEDLADVRTALEGLLRRGDLCLTMGAGDLTELPAKWLGEEDAT